MKRDDGIKSVKENCIKLVSRVGLYHEDGIWCSSGARLVCTHQMNMECVSLNLATGAREGCKIYSYDPLLEKYKEDYAYWIKNIQNCQSDIPTLKQ